MRKIINTGTLGEQLACNWLRSQGFSILEQNYWLQNYEIDIIAQRLQFIHFIEVKTRSSLNFGQPESFVDNSKLDRMKIVAIQYLEEQPKFQKYWPQYDIIAVTLYQNNTHKIDYIRDLF